MRMMDDLKYFESNDKSLAPAVVPENDWIKLFTNNNALTYDEIYAHADYWDSGIDDARRFYLRDDGIRVVITGDGVAGNTQVLTAQDDFIVTITFRIKPTTARSADFADATTPDDDDPATFADAAGALVRVYDGSGYRDTAEVVNGESCTLEFKTGDTLDWYSLASLGLTGAVEVALLFTNVIVRKNEIASGFLHYVGSGLDVSFNHPVAQSMNAVLHYAWCGDHQSDGGVFDQLATQVQTLTGSTQHSGSDFNNLLGWIKPSVTLASNKRAGFQAILERFVENALPALVANGALCKL
jgi:hypothetical protein